MQPKDVLLYNEVALGVNAPIYTYYATRIVTRTGIVNGRCLDVGCGGGYLGLALARITSLDFVFFDQSPEMLACAEENITRFDCATRARTLHGRVQAIPLEDDSIDLVISRGSVPFWDDLPTAFAELHRVLRPGGQAYVGGGLGDPKDLDKIEKQRLLAHPHWKNKGHRPPHHDNQHYTDGLTQAGILSFAVNRSDEGLWISFSKESA
ncbi:MAG: class I SAM-dependent methyltransferase [Desulfobulbus sp.]|nr:class I SAM-dependent methyltransferase [Desulfobulbus sp.]